MRSDSWQIERDFVPATLEEAVQLQRAIEAAGFSRAIAMAIPQWLARKATGEDPVPGPQRTRYRKVLASLNGSYPGPGRRHRKVDATPPYISSPSSDPEPLAA